VEECINVMKKIITGIIAGLLCLHALDAQNFATRQLEYMASLLICPLPQQSGTFYCPQISSLPIVVEYDRAGTVCHLGFSLFSPSMKNNTFPKTPYDFQERFFLEIFLQGSEEKARKLMQEYNVHCSDYSRSLGAGTFFQSLENSLRLSAEKNVQYTLSKDSLRWKSEWEGKNSNFSTLFPANFDLIFGMDKKEAELWLAHQLQNIACVPSNPPPISVKIEDMEPLKQSIYVRRGKNLFIENMNNNMYFDSSPVFNRNYPEESIANLFNFPDTKRSKGFVLQIKQTAYGGESQLYKVKLSDFQCYLGDDYEVFTGIEKCTDQALDFTVIYKSKWYNYSLLLYVQTTPEKLFNQSGPLQAILYTFIPNQNIKNLYKEYIPRKIKIELE
jgi:hypothetical protein